MNVEEALEELEDVANDVRQTCPPLAERMDEAVTAIARVGGPGSRCGGEAEAEGTQRSRTVTVEVQIHCPGHWSRTSVEQIVERGRTALERVVDGHGCAMAFRRTPK